MNELRRYYDQKATLNVHHRETILDIFRHCARKDTVLPSALNSNLKGFDFNEALKESANIVADMIADNASITQPKPMEVDSQSRIEGLCNIKLLKSFLKQHWMVWLGMVQAS